MLLLIFSLALVFFSAIPAILFCWNLKLFCLSPPVLHADAHNVEEPISVLIPARNEEVGIRAALTAVLANNYPRIEVIVLDDASTDSTAAIVREVAQHDNRVKLVASLPLPPGWNGKQFACWQLARESQFDWLLFVDADVRLSQDAIARVQTEAVSKNAELVSGFPRQETFTLAEKMLIPLMHFILLGYLPIARMRASRGVEFSAGCGQLFLARRKSYFECGGHRAIQTSRHDGIALPKAFRSHGMLTDIFDASAIATCRMYRSTSEVVRGLLKNATEGIANPYVILPFSLLLLGGAVLPAVALILSLAMHASPAAQAILAVATCLSYLPRILATIRFRQSWLGAALHPLGVAWFLSLQWLALTRYAIGKPVSWRGRI